MGSSDVERGHGSKPSDIAAQTIEVVQLDEQQARPGDKAAELLITANHRVFVTPEDNKRILRQIDWAILPIILVVCCLQSLDKTALSYASVFGLIQDANLHGTQFSWLGSVVFLLGSFEASVAPTFIALVQMWYRRSEQANRNAAWYSMLGVVNILGSLLSYGLAHIHSDRLHPYQIIFLFCGLLTVLFSFVVFFFLPDSPMQARFLHDEDKLLAIERLRANQMGISSGVWRWDHVRECLLDVKMWIWVLMLFTISIPSGGISTFGPLLVKAFGFSSFTTILFNMPFGAVQMMATIGSAVAATKWKRKSPILAMLCIPPIIGISILLGVEYNKQNRGVLLFAYYITSVYPAISPLIYSWSGPNTAGDTKRKVTTGMMFIGASVGNIVGPLLYQPSEAPHFTRGLRSNLALIIILLVLIGLGAGYIALLNRKHAAARLRLGKSATVIDLSMVTPGASSPQDDESDPKTIATGEKAFDDITDLKNEDFVYVY